MLPVGLKNALFNFLNKIKGFEWVICTI